MGNVYNRRNTMSDSGNDFIGLVKKKHRDECLAKLAEGIDVHSKEREGEAIFWACGMGDINLFLYPPIDFLLNLVIGNVYNKEKNMNSNDKQNWTREQWVEYAKEFSMLPEYRDKTLPEHIRLDHEINRIQLIDLHKEDHPRVIEKYFPQELLDDKQFIRDSFLVDMSILQLASERLLNDPQFALELMEMIEEKHDPKDYSRQLDFTFLRMMHQGAKNDKEVWITAIQTTNPYLTIKDNIFDYNYIGNEIQKDQDFIVELATMKHEADLYFKDDENMNHFSYSQINRKFGQGYSLPYEFITELKYEKEFAMKVVAADPIAYASVGSELQKDKDVAMAAYNSDNESIIILRGEILEDKELALIAVAKAPEAIFDRLPEELQADRDIMVAALSEHTFEFRNRHIDPMLLSDREIMKMAISNIGGNANYAPLAFRNDPEFVLETKCFASMSDRLKREVGNQDPDQAIQSIINKNKLEIELAEKPSKADRLVSSIDENADTPTKRTSSSRMKI